VSTGQTCELPISAHCIWKEDQHWTMNAMKLSVCDQCTRAWFAGRKYERDYVPFTETAPDEEELYDVMLHETEG
jgi:competence transcription factor ComK